MIALRWGGREVQIEVRWIGSPELQGDQRCPLVVFLHEGLGSVSAWGGFPERLCKQLSIAGLVYSRPGYGQSTQCSIEERWESNYLHRQAEEVLPLLLATLGVRPELRPIFLLGHSDGASIALIYASRRSIQLAGLVVMAPHIFVEDITISGVEAAREAFLTGRLRERLARHHRDPDSAFWGWNRIWLDPQFRSWSIEDQIVGIDCPILAMQGLQDGYATMAQLQGIKLRLPQTWLLEIPDCGHSPHRAHPDLVCRAIQEFVIASLS